MTERNSQDDVARAARFAALGDAIAATRAEDLASWRAEAECWDAADLELPR